MFFTSGLGKNEHGGGFCGLVLLCFYCINFFVLLFLDFPDTGAWELGVLGGMGRVLPDLRRWSAVLLQGVRQPRPEERGEVL